MINRDGNAAARSAAVTGACVSSRGQQTLVSQSIGYRGNCCGRLYFTKTFIVCEEKGSITDQRSSDASAKLVAHECWNRTASQIKVVPGIERSISVELPQRSMQLITSCFGHRLDYATCIPAVLR